MVVIFADTGRAGAGFINFAHRSYGADLFRYYSGNPHKERHVAICSPSREPLYIYVYVHTYLSLYMCLYVCMHV